MKRFLCGMLMVAGLSLPSSWAGLADGLVLNYSFSGNFNDTSGQGNNPVSHGVVLAADSSNRVNSAAYFNGQGSYLDAGAASSINLVGPLSISAWINPDEVGGYGSMGRSIVGKWYDIGGAPLRQYVLGLVVGGHPVFDVGAGAGYEELILWDVTIQTGRWTHLVGVYSGTNLIVYVDGVERDRKATTMPMSAQNVNLTMGKAVAGDYGATYYKGKMDELRIYNRALSPQEVNALLTQGGGALPPLVFPAYSCLVGLSNAENGDQNVSVFDGSDRLYIRLKDESLNSQNSKCWAVAQLWGKKLVKNRIKDHVVTFKLTPQEDGSFLGQTPLSVFYPGDVVVTVYGYSRTACWMQRAATIEIE